MIQEKGRFPTRPLENGNDRDNQAEKYFSVLHTLPRDPLFDELRALYQTLMREPISPALEALLERYRPAG